MRRAEEAANAAHGQPVNGNGCRAGTPFDVRMPRARTAPAGGGQLRTSICTGNSFSMVPSFALRLYATTS